MFYKALLPYCQKNPHDKQEIRQSYQLELTVELHNQSMGCKLSVGPGCTINNHFEYNSRELFTHDSLNKPFPLFQSEKACLLIMEKIKQTFDLYKNTPVSFLLICIKYADEKKETMRCNITIENALIKLDKKINQVKENIKVLQNVSLDEVTLNENEEVPNEGCVLF